MALKHAVLAALLAAVAVEGEKGRRKLVDHLAAGGLGGEGDHAGAELIEGDARPMPEGRLAPAPVPGLYGG